MQVDELVREVQLGLYDEAVAEGERERFFSLLTRSAPARLSGRRAALAAAADGARRFDFAVAVDAPMIDAVDAFADLLVLLPSRLSVTGAAPTQQVLDFREWITQEVMAQIAGAEPTPCSLPDD
jgi:hypothetical protein